ncbi:MAG: hypothetical protein RL119_237 [Actinomycetota bacterium]|jgi:hypothetical protein
MIQPEQHFNKSSVVISESAPSKWRSKSFLSAGFLLALTLLGVACGDSSSTTGASGPLGTVGGVRALVQPVTTPPDYDQDLSTSPTVGGKALTVGEAAEGPRLLMVGDSVFAALATRYGDLACQTLNPQGWEVSVEAEVGRFIDQGLKFVNRKIPQGFDAVVFFMGTNYRNDQADYRAILVQILDQLSSVPVVLLTASEHRFEISEVNDVIIEQVGQRDNVWLIDWRRLSKKPGVLSKDGIHPSEDGEIYLISEIAAVLGTAPGNARGACLPSEFVADSNLEEGAEFGGTTP